MIDKKCIKCGVNLNVDNWYPSFMKRGAKICRECQMKYTAEQRKIEKYREYHRRYNLRYYGQRRKSRSDA